MICNNCGEPIQKEIILLGVSRKVPIVCRCRKEEMYLKDRSQKAIERQEKLKQLFTNSLMDKKFEFETFESWDFEKGTKQIYNIGVNYCEKFQEVKKEGLGFLIY